MHWVGYDAWSYSETLCICTCCVIDECRWVQAEYPHNPHVFDLGDNGGKRKRNTVSRIFPHFPANQQDYWFVLPQFPSFSCIFPHFPAKHVGRNSASRIFPHLPAISRIFPHIKKAYRFNMFKLSSFKLCLVATGSCFLSGYWLRLPQHQPGEREVKQRWSFQWQAFPRVVSSLATAGPWNLHSPWGLGIHGTRYTSLGIHP